jgi:hypothetical protein
VHYVYQAFYFIFFQPPKFFILYTSPIKEDYMTTKNNYRFAFTFDNNYVGRKEYTGTLTLCVRQFNCDQRKRIIPAVKSVIKVEKVD